MNSVGRFNLNLGLILLCGNNFWFRRGTESHLAEVDQYCLLRFETYHTFGLEIELRECIFYLLLLLPTLVAKLARAE
jgi:hypothetical protein